MNEGLLDNNWNSTLYGPLSMLGDDNIEMTKSRKADVSSMNICWFKNKTGQIVNCTVSYEYKLMTKSTTQPVDTTI